MSVSSGALLFCEFHLGFLDLFFAAVQNIPLPLLRTETSEYSCLGKRRRPLCCTEYRVHDGSSLGETCSDLLWLPGTGPHFNEKKNQNQNNLFVSLALLCAKKLCLLFVNSPAMSVGHSIPQNLLPKLSYSSCELLKNYSASSLNCYFSVLSKLYFSKETNRFSSVYFIHVSWWCLRADCCTNAEQQTAPALLSCDLSRRDMR